MKKWGRMKYYPLCFFLMIGLFWGSSYQVQAEDIEDRWDESYFGKIILDPDTGQMEKDGQPLNFYKEFSVSSSEKKAVIKSEDSLEEYLKRQDEDMIYETETNEKGEIEITAPFQTKRLIVDGNLSETYGAENVSYDEEEQNMILEFDTQQETRDAWEAICEDYGDAICYPDEIYYLDDILMDTGVGNYNVTSWGTSYMGMDVLKVNAPARGYYRNVTVAVLDTGIDRSNSMFASRTISSKSYNLAANNNNITDTHGHGTHVAGIISDATPANVQIMMLKIANSQGYSSLQTIRKALQYAVKQKADVINMSVGVISVQADECTYLDSIINKAYTKGIPIVAAAGNNGVNVKYCYPACNKKTIAISALDGNGHLAYYSNRGSAVDFSAPGSEIVSAKAGGTLVGMSGTSMAAPHISAAIAYLKMMQSNLSVSGVYQELKVRCRDLGTAGKDSNYGWGCPVLTGLFDTGIINRTKIVGVASPTLKSVKNKEQGIGISWKKVKGATKYLIYRKTGNGSYKKIGTVSAKKTSYLDKKVVQGKKYSYGVKTVKSGKKSTISNKKTIVYLKQIGKISAKNGAGTKVTFLWTKQKKVTGYQVRFSRRKNWKNSQTITTTKNVRKLVQKGLRRKVYYYKVRSYRKMGTTVYYSPWSSVKKIKVR